jgi:hypothetical protein
LLEEAMALMSHRPNKLTGGMTTANGHRVAIKRPGLGKET